MNIKKIVDKIIKEADIQANHYTVADRIDDVNAEYLALIETASQIAGENQPSEEETKTQEETITTAEEQSIVRDVPDVDILKIEYRTVGSEEWTCLSKGVACDDCWGCLECPDTRFAFDEKTIFIKDGREGELRITYAHGSVTVFTSTDYVEATPPSPVMLPEVFHPLLWMGPAIRKASYYKKDGRAKNIKVLRDELYSLFEDHYSRNNKYKAIIRKRVIEK